MIAFKSSHFQLGCIELRPFIRIYTKRLILCFGSWVIWGQFWNGLTVTKVDKYQILVFKVPWWWICDEQKDNPLIRKYTWLKKINFLKFRKSMNRMNSGNFSISVFSLRKSMNRVHTKNFGYIDVGDKWMLVTLSCWQFLDASDRISILEISFGCWGPTLMLKDRGYW